MTLAAAHTWRHLLPRDRAYTCASAESALRHLAEDGGSGAPVCIAADPSALSAAELNTLDGVVAVNPKSDSTEHLHAAGFGCIRRLAVLPSLANPRWFIPLDTPALAAAGFSLYSPARRLARMKYAAAVMAARWLSSGWYRDSIWICRREPSPLEQAMAKLFGQPAVRIALSAGAPEPARNRKTSAAVLGLKGQILGFAKLAGSPLSRRLVEHEGQALSAMPQLLEFSPPTPRLLFADEVEGTYVSVQSPLPGKPSAPRLTSAHERFLAGLQTSQVKSAAATSLIRQLAIRIDALPVKREEFGEIFHDLLPALEKLKVHRTIVHGDFAPWNVRLHHGGVSVFDWEYAELDGLPLLDRVHFTLQVGYQMDNWSSQRASQELHAMAQSRHLGLMPQEARLLQAVYLLDVLTRLLSEGYDPDEDMLAWHWRLLLGLTAHKPEVVLS